MSWHISVDDLPKRTELEIRSRPSRLPSAVDLDVTGWETRPSFCNSPEPGWIRIRVVNDRDEELQVSIHMGDFATVEGTDHPVALQEWDGRYVLIDPEVVLDAFNRYGSEIRHYRIIPLQVSRLGE